jgi:hypothetical protein
MTAVTLPDPSSDRAPDSVAAIKDFKASLIRSGGNTKSSNVIGTLQYTQPTVATDTTMYDEEVTDRVEEVNEIENEPEESPISKSNKDPMHMLVDYLEATPAKEEVKIIGAFGRIGFKAVNVSINEFGVAFIIKKDAIQFEPNINTQLKVNYRGQDYDVIYAGGFFTFPKIPFTFVSFLRVTE